MNRVYLALPCFNPTELQWTRFSEFIKTLKNYPNLGLGFDLGVIDDGSPLWVEPPQDLKSEFSLLRLPKNVGKGAAVLAAIQNVKKDYSIFAFMDFNLPYAAEDLVRLC